MRVVVDGNKMRRDTVEDNSLIDMKFSMKWRFCATQCISPSTHIPPLCPSVKNPSTFLINGEDAPSRSKLMIPLHPGLVLGNNTNSATETLTETPTI